MSLAAALVRLLPLGFMSRLALAFTEITLAVVVVSGSVVVGHELKAWREWFWDPATYHPWAPTPKPSPSIAAAQRPVAIPAAAPTSDTATAAAPMVVGYGANCRPTAANEQLVFITKVAAGADCVRLVSVSDGTHLVVETYLGSSTDFGIVATADDMPNVRVFAPTTWPSPVLVVRGSTTRSASTATVLTWQSRAPLRLLGVSGQKIDLATDTAGWPRVIVTSTDGVARRIYVWTGSAFSAQ